MPYRFAQRPTAVPSYGDGIVASLPQVTPEGTRFVFDVDYDPDKVEIGPASSAEPGTAVKLEDMAEPYRKLAPRSLEEIAVTICEHFLLLFVRENLPELMLFDKGLIGPVKAKTKPVT